MWYILCFSSGWVQQNSPPNKLPLIFSNDSSVIDVSDGNIDLVQELASRKLVTIVMLYARWCPQSKLVAKQLEHVADVFKEEVEMQIHPDYILYANWLFFITVEGGRGVYSGCRLLDCGREMQASLSTSYISVTSGLSLQLPVSISTRC